MTSQNQQQSRAGKAIGVTLCIVLMCIPVAFADESDYMPIVPSGNLGSPIIAGSVSAANNQYDDVIQASASLADVDAGQLKALIEGESAFRPSAISSANAVGLTQIMVSTAREVYNNNQAIWDRLKSSGISNANDITTETLKNPDVNVPLGAQYMRQMQNRFGTQGNEWIQGYNRGPGNVDVNADVSALHGETQRLVNIISEETLVYQADFSSCFLPSTSITLADRSTKQIRSIAAGDNILSYDIEAENTVISHVQEVFSRLANQYFIINNDMKVTGEHWVYAKKSQ